MLVPKIVTVKKIKHHTKDVFTIWLADDDGNEKFPFAAGQFNMLYHFGFGEVAISISGDPTQDEGYMHTLRAVGNVTNALQLLKEGDQIGLRGPFGTHWPLDIKGHDVMIVAGGLGLPPLRPALQHMMAHREDFGEIKLLYGARTPNDFLFDSALARWEANGVHIERTVDSQTPEWTGNVGVVTKLISKHLKNPEKTLFYTCGPEVMIKATIKDLPETLDPKKVFISMERNMQCGVGLCGHCQMGPYFVCKDGPVFTLEQLKPWLPIHEL